MASVINTNMASLYAQKNLSGAQNALATSVERLSSGLRINRAKDDAAGLGISQQIQSQVRALNQGIRNANDAVSMVQTAEGSLSEVSSILQRMKELAVQGRNESLDNTQRQYIADELISLRKEINAIAERTSYNGMSLLKNALRSQVGSTLSDTGMFAEGAKFASGVSVKNLKVDTANVGSYSFSVRNEVAEPGFSAASNVNQEAVPTVDADGQKIGANSARTIAIDEGDVFEGGKMSITISGDEGTITYAAVAGQDSDAESLAEQLVAKLSRDYSGSVSAENGTITFSADAGVGIAKIDVSLSILESDATVANVRSRVDSPLVSAASERNITLNDFDIREGRKLTVRVGNPNTYAQFSTYVGAGADKQSVAQDLVDLISQKYSGVSLASSAEDGNNVIAFAASANLGQAAISLTVEETKETKSSLTISFASDAYGIDDQDRSVEIVDADVDPGRVFTLSVDGKNYAYKAVQDDTAASVAYALSDLLAKDYATVNGTVDAADITVSATQGGSSVSGQAASVALTFRALSAGETFNVGSLGFTANRNVSASELADAFANISAGGSGNSVAYGSFAGTLVDSEGNAYSSGAKATSGANFVVSFSAQTTGTSVDPADLAISVNNTEASTVEVSIAATDGATAATTKTIASQAIAINGIDSATDLVTLTGHGFNTGDAITLDGLGGAVGFTAGTTYYAIYNDANTFKLATSASNASAGTAVNITTDNTTGAVNVLKVTNIEDTDAFTITSHGFVTGDKVNYDATTTAASGLTDGADYYVIKLNDNSFQLATSLENAVNGVRIDLAATQRPVGTQTFTKQNDENTTVNISRAGGLTGDQVTIDGVTLTLTEAASGAEIAEAFANYMRYGTTTDFGSFSGTASGRYTALLQTEPRAAESIASGTVVAGTNTITRTGHGFVTGDKVLYDESTNPMIHGLTDGQFYYVIRDSADAFRLAASYSDALSGAVTATALSTDGVNIATDTFTDVAHGLLTGDRVAYSTAGTEVGGLSEAVTNYFVIKTGADTFKLATTKANAEAGTAINITGAGVGSQVFTKAAGVEVDLTNYTDNIRSVTFDGTVAAVTVATDSITLSGHGFETGDAVDYSNGGGTSITGLTTGNTYYVIKSDNDTVKLASSRTNALAGTAVDLTVVGVGVAHSLTKTFTSTVDSDSSGVDVGADTLYDVAHELETGDKVTYAAGDTVVGGLVDGQTYYVIKTNADRYQLAETLSAARAGNALGLTSTGAGTQTFTKSGISAISLTRVDDAVSTYASKADGTNVITTGTHNYTTGDMVRYHVASDGTAITGLVDGQNYYAIVDSTTTFRLASSYANTQTSAVTVTIDSTDTSVVSTANDTITSASHGLLTGDRVLYTGAGTAIGGLTTATAYYVIRQDNDTIKLATTQARALSGDAMDLTAVGTSTTATLVKSAGTEIDISGTPAGSQMFERISNEVVFSANVDHDNEDLTDMVASSQRLAASTTSVSSGDVVRSAGTTAVDNATESYEMSFDEDMSMLKGDSVTVGGLRFTANTTLNRDQIAAAFAGLFDGATRGQGLEYGSYSGKLRGYQSSAAAEGVVTFTSTAANADVQDLTWDASAVKQAVSIGGPDSNVITLTKESAKLGVAEIGISVKRYSDAGVLTMTAGADTGIGGTSQSVNLDTIASGASKYFNFDKLGISFNLDNASGAALNSTVLEEKGSMLSGLSVSSAMDGKALFQVGASVRDTVEIDGFKDIRIGAFNKNADNTVFKNLGATMDAIAAGDLDPINTFATLESQIEEMITSISGFRANFGAQQNRIDFAIANLRVQSDNMTKANSNIVDTDYAAETANLTKTQIMQQAATAMLAQANQMPNVILALLK